MAVFMSWLGFQSLSKSIVREVVPGLSEVARDILPSEIGEEMFVVTPQLHIAFFILLCVVVVEKIMTYVVMELSAISIAQRFAKNQHILNEQGATPMVSNEQMLLFSPAARYVGVTAQRESIYAGIPRFMWHVAIDFFGFMVQGEQEEQYHVT